MSVSVRQIGAPSMSQAPLVEYEQKLDEAFPDVDPQHEPFRELILVQYRSPKLKTKSGIVLTAETQSNIQWNNQIVKVRAIGPLAFRNRDTMEMWPEGPWFKVGAFIRMGKYGADKWEVRYGDGVVIFGLVVENELLAKIPDHVDPLTIMAYV